MGEALTDQAEPLNLLYYGDGGTGKTTHLAHMAEVGKILVINAESGVKRRALEREKVPVKNIEIWPSKDEDITFESIEAEWLRIREALHKKPDAYAGVVWDSLTEIYKVLLDQAVIAGEEWEEKTGKKRDPRQDYNTMADQIRKLVRRFRDLPCHFGVSALERRDVDQEDGKVFYRPSITPSLQTDLYGWFDLVCHTNVEIVGGGEQFRGLFKPLGKYRGKDRFKVMPRELVNPTFPRVLAYVEETLVVDKDPTMIQAQKQIENSRKKESDTDA